MTLTYEETKAEMVQLRGWLVTPPSPGQQQQWCARNCELVGHAVVQGWDDLVKYGCETDTLYCGGTCPHCPT